MTYTELVINKIIDSFENRLINMADGSRNSRKELIAIIQEPIATIQIRDDDDLDHGAFSRNVGK